MTPLEQRQLELWPDEMMSRTRWSYADAVLWVAFLNLDRLREWRTLPELMELKPEDGALGAAIAIENAVASSVSKNKAIGVAEISPRMTLDVALKDGRVHGTGEHHRQFAYGGEGTTGRKSIPVEVWEDYIPVHWIGARWKNKTQPLVAGLKLVPHD